MTVTLINTMADFLRDAFEDEDFDEILDMLEDSDSYEEPRGGSRAGRSATIERYREEGASRLFSDYFCADSTYPAHVFERRFRGSRAAFIDIWDALQSKVEFFKTKKDAAWKVGLNVYQKCTAAMQKLAYGTCSDAVDEYVLSGDSTARDCPKKFASSVVDIYKDQYVRPLNAAETKILLQRENSLGFPGMLGSIDCCKWVWKNCPTAHHGQYKGKERVPAVTMEAIADDRLYFWHFLFGIAGFNNDLTVLD